MENVHEISRRKQLINIHRITEKQNTKDSNTKVQLNKGSDDF